MLLTLTQVASVAQLLERRHVEPEALGSNPDHGCIFFPRLMNSHYLFVSAVLKLFKCSLKNKTFQSSNLNFMHTLMSIHIYTYEYFIKHWTEIQY